jgi:hypothetical protein
VTPYYLDDLPKPKRRVAAIDSEILFQERGHVKTFALCPHCRRAESRGGRGCLTCWRRYRILAEKEEAEMSKDKEPPRVRGRRRVSP